MKVSGITIFSVRPGTILSGFPTGSSKRIPISAFCIRDPTNSTQFPYFYLLTEGVQRKVEGLQDGATYPAIRDDSAKGRASFARPSLPAGRAALRFPFWKRAHIVVPI